MRLVILDRDGVINRDSREFVKSPREWRAIDGSLEAIGRLTQAGWTVAVASNQSGIGRGLVSRAALKAMHRKMRREAARHGGRIDRIVVCPHHPDDGCACRKPAPELLLRLSRHYGTALHDVPAVGDSERDLGAARAAGAIPVLVRTGNGLDTERTLASRGENVEIYDDLLAFAGAVITNTRARGS